MKEVQPTYQLPPREKYKPSKIFLSCTICGADTNEECMLCFNCLNQMTDGDNLDIAERVEESDFDKRDKTIEGIREKVQEFSGVKDITIKTRKREIVEARQVAQYLAKKHTDLSLAGIGWQLGKKDHATVLHSVKTVKNLLGDKQFRKKYIDLIEYFKVKEEAI